ncbi:acyltransferase family protein [Butyrivibrio proteoclasticus]|uniref:acyltransferase family protein n=1 Tax=Butyrivibrio proteoclasticus TaxID=43305 RepID=UPI00047B9E86|nr:acyltransferase [Butyrivibrio proteoclasticus]
MSRDERYVWVDSLKGIAILGVIMIHSGAMSVGGIIGKIGQYGSSFVQAFFVISAFLTWKSLDIIGREMTIRTGIKWVAKKLLSLVPMYYMAIFLYLFLVGGNHYWAGDKNPLSVFSILVHLLFLHGLFPKYCDCILGVEWYLGVLSIFYFIAIPLHKVIKNFPRSLCFFVITSIVSNHLSILACGYYEANGYAYIYQQYYNNFSIIAQLPTLTLGIVLYYLLQFDLNKYLKKKNIKCILSCASIVLATLVLKYFGVVDSFIPIFTLTVPTLFALVFTIYIFGQDLYSIPILNNRMLSYIGKNSLGIYLFHVLIIYIYDCVIHYSFGLVAVDWFMKYLVVVFISTMISVILNKLLSRGKK